MSAATQHRSEPAAVQASITTSASLRIEARQTGDAELFDIVATDGGDRIFLATCSTELAAEAMLQRLQQALAIAAVGVCELCRGQGSWRSPYSTECEPCPHCQPQDVSTSAPPTAAPKPTVISSTESAFITIPATTLPNGTVVPAFAVARYLSSFGRDNLPAITREGKPWVSLNYRDVREVCKIAGLALITELQWLAIAHLIVQQDENWTRGKVGAGALYQGLHLATRYEPQPATYESRNKTERRWFALPGGERIYDFAGNVFSWVFDDVQGDAEGLIAKPFAADSPSLTTAPYPSETKGMGWRPAAGRDWSGNALIRGGCWGSDSYAGVFRLGYVWPGNANVIVGFRCTKPGL